MATLVGMGEKFGTAPPEWDQLYRTHGRLPGDDPNEVLVARCGDLEPGRALEIGCGVGGDAIWLARRGWQVTGVDVSQVALAHAKEGARLAGVDIDWRWAGLEELAPEGYDLVTAFYPALHRSASGTAERALLRAVAPGGILLIVHHADIDVERSKSFGFDPEHYVSHDDVVAALGDGWQVDLQRRRPRVMRTDATSPHSHDDLIMARRLG